MRPFDGLIAAPASPLAGADPLVKLCAAFTTVLAISTFPPLLDWRHGAIVAILCALWLLARIPVGYVARRFVAATPFIAMAAALPLAAQLPEGGDLAIAVAWKAYSAILLLSILAATTPIEDILESLRRLGVPRGFALTTVLMHRYLFVLLEEWRGIARARECRTGGRVRASRTRVWANQAAMVFVRGWDRAERVSQAMLTRGFRGEFPRLARSRPGPWDIACGVLLPLAVVALRMA